MKMFDFFLKPKFPYESHLSMHTSEPLKKIVQILETRLQSCKNSQNGQKIVKLMMYTKLVFGFQ